MDGVLHVTLLQARSAPPGGGDLDLVAAVLEAPLVVQLTLVLLPVMSVGSWFVAGTKAVGYARAGSLSARFVSDFWRQGEGEGWTPETLEALYARSKSLAAAPVAQVFRAGYVELAKLSADGLGGAPLENVERALRRAMATEQTRLESLLSLLATTGSTAPFIGLFGTVVGILSSFQTIARTGSASLDVVGNDIAEALIATAVGLVAAIPAVMAYNALLRRLRVLSAEMDAFGADFLNVVRRHYLGG
jgi:biopolymer transport protein TolQ